MSLATSPLTPLEPQNPSLYYLQSKYFFSPKRVSSSEGVSPVNNPVTWVHAEWYSPVDEGILWRNFQTYLRLSICLTLSLAGIS